MATARLTVHKDMYDEIIFAAEELPEYGEYGILDLARAIYDDPECENVLMQIAEKLYKYEEAEESGRLVFVDDEKSEHNDENAN